MKRLSTLTISLSFFMFSCSTEELTLETQTTIISENVPEYLQRDSPLPLNRLNPFEDTGLAYYEIMEDYNSNEGSLSNTAAIILSLENAAANSQAFQAISDSNTAFVDVDAINIVRAATHNMNAVINHSPLSLNAKSMLQTFVVALEDSVLNDTTAEVHDLLLEFEIAVSNPPTSLTSADEAMLFTIASIARYSNDLDGDHKDKKWTTIKSMIAITLDMNGNLGNSVLNSAAINIID